MNQARIAIPDSVIQAVSGRPVVGEWEPIFQLLTTDEAGWPRICLLSRAETVVRAGSLVVVVSSSSVKANLQRDGRGTLCVYTSDSLVHCVADFSQTAEKDSWARYDGTMRALRIDSLNIPLSPPRFLATAEIGALENWEACAELLEGA